MHEVDKRWPDQTVVVAAPGPSLPFAVELLGAWPSLRTVAVGDAYRLLGGADVLYHADDAWWRYHKGVPAFRGERWTSVDTSINPKDPELYDMWQVRRVRGEVGDEFSLLPDVIRYGANSGFQAINLAMLFGARRIVLVGYDMRLVDGQGHFFGSHPLPLRNGNPQSFIPWFNHAAAHLPRDVEVLNATPGSALTCFPQIQLEDVL